MVERIWKEHWNVQLKESATGKELELDFHWVSAMVQVVQTVLVKAMDLVQAIQSDCWMVIDLLVIWMAPVKEQGFHWEH